VRVLDDRQPPRALDRDETRHAVIERARQHDANDPRPKRQRGAAKQRVNGGAEVVFPRAIDDARAPLREQQMAIWWRDGDTSTAYLVAILRHHRRQRPGV